MRPPVSIITPCYNHGIYLDEAFNSIRLNEYGQYFEHIIVDDGSTDVFTLNKMKELECKGSKVIQQPNLGLGAARNAGIDHATGKYIIPLDADNRLRPEVFIKAFHLMESDPSLSVVYTDAYHFGEQDRQSITGPFDIHKLINWNYIDACALVSKDAFIKAGRYDEGMPAMGHEDWDLWMAIAAVGGVFHYLPETGFEYRVVSDSMSVTQTAPGFIKNRAYLFGKHAGLVSEAYTGLMQKNEETSKTLARVNSALQNEKIKACIKVLLGRRFY